LRVLAALLCAAGLHLDVFQPDHRPPGRFALEAHLAHLAALALASQLLAGCCHTSNPSENERVKEDNKPETEDSEERST
jgi:hypothetical protein